MTPLIMLVIATVTWQHPTQRVDNSVLPLNEIGSTEIQWDLDSPNLLWPNAKSVGSPATSVQLDIPAGKYCFRAATRDTEGLQSDWTAPVCVNLKARPGKPIILTVTRP